MKQWGETAPVSSAFQGGWGTFRIFPLKKQATISPTTPQSTRAVREGRGGYGVGYGAPWAACARALFWAWPNSARHRVWPRPGGSCRCTKVGVPQYPNLCTGSCSFPRQGLPRARRRPFLLPIKPFKNKVYKEEDQDPGKRSLPGRPYQAQDCPANTRPWQEELARKTGRYRLGAMRAPARGPGSGQFPGPARSRPRQGACREGCAVCPRSSSSAHASPWGLSRDAWRMAVQPGGHGGTPRWWIHRRGRRRRKGGNFWGRRRRALNALVPHC